MATVLEPLVCSTSPVGSSNMRELKGLPDPFDGEATAVSVFADGSYSKKDSGKPQATLVFCAAAGSYGATRHSTRPLGNRTAGASLAPVVRPATTTGKLGPAL